MYPLQIAVCDDSSLDAKLLIDCMEKTSFFIKYDYFESGEALLAKFYPTKYDCIFMDIYMSGIAGIQIVEEIRRIDENILVAFTTTSPDHALESYRLGVAKYIEKPVTAKAVNDTLELALSKRKALMALPFMIDRQKELIALDNIMFFEQKEHMVMINMVDGSSLTAWHIKLSELKNKLPSPPFLHCHHSFIVNFKFVKCLDKELQVFRMKNGKSVHIRREDFKNSKNAFNHYLFETARGQLNED